MLKHPLAGLTSPFAKFNTRCFMSAFYTILCRQALHEVQLNGQSYSKDRGCWYKPSQQCPYGMDHRNKVSIPDSRSSEGFRKPIAYALPSTAKGETLFYSPRILPAYQMNGWKSSLEHMIFVSGQAPAAIFLSSRTLNDLSLIVGQTTSISWNFRRSWGLN